MIRSDKKFNSYQLVVTIICSMLGVAILQLPSSLAESVGSESFIVMIGGGVAAIISTLLICSAGSIYNGKGLVDTSKDVFGKGLGVILVIPIALCIFMANVVEARIFTLTVKVFLLEKTPIAMILIPFLLIVALLARGELKHIISFFQFVLPFIIVIIVVLNILTIPGSDFSNLLPVFQRTSIEYLDGVSLTLFSFLGILSLLVIYPYLKKRDFKSTFKASLVGVATVIILYISFIVLCLAKLGVSETEWLIYPTVSLIKSAYVPGSFVERLEGILMSVWVILAFATIVITIYSLAIIIADIFKFRATKHVVTILIPLVYMASTSVFSILDMMKVSTLNNIYLGLYTMFIFPGILYIGYKIKNGRRGGSSE